jgi:hypothetical protein
LYTMKVENNACIWPKWKVSQRLKPKNNWSIGSKDWEFKDGGTRKSKSFLRNGTENSGLCIAQAKTINFDEPFLVLIP